MKRYSKSIMMQLIVVCCLCIISSAQAGSVVTYDGVTESIAGICDVGYNSDNNRLDVINGASVSVSAGMSVSNRMYADHNIVSVRNLSTLNVGTHLVVGSNGQYATLEISSGSVVNSLDYAAVGLGDKSDYNIAEIAGAGSCWNVGKGLYIGGYFDRPPGVTGGAYGLQWGDYNLLEIKDGGTVSSQKLRVYSNNTLKVNNGIIEVDAGMALELRGTEFFEGNNILRLKCDSIDSVLNSNIMLMKNLDSQSLIDSFSVQFIDSNGELFVSDSAIFNYDNGSWGMQTGEEFTAVP